MKTTHEHPLLVQLYLGADDHEHDVLDEITRRIGLADEQGLLAQKPWDAAPQLLRACKAVLAVIDAPSAAETAAMLPRAVVKLVRAAVSDAE